MTGTGNQATGLIFDIQGYSVHDGPGCRTLVFLSGCPLRCTWCANPEGQRPQPQLMFHEARCVHRHYSCARACIRDAVQIGDDQNPFPQFDRSICQQCQTRDCVAAC